MWKFLFLLALAVGAYADGNFNIDTVSTEFIIAFPQRTFGALPATFENFTLLITAKENVLVEVSSGDPLILPAQTYLIFAHQTTVIVLPTLIQATGNNIVENKGILVRSFFPADVPFSLIGFSEEVPPPGESQGTSGGFLALPKEALGNVYRALSFIAPEEFFLEWSEILIVAAYDNTVVEITTPVTIPGFPALIPVSITLNRLQTFQLQAGGFLDLTGTLIVAKKPVGFLSGGTCLEVPLGVVGCDHLVEMIPPIENYGTKFLIVPFQGRTAGDIVRVVATKDNTQVYVNGSLVGALQAFQFFEFTSSSFAGTYVNTNKPVVVGQYAKGRDADEGRNLDPLEVYVPSKEQYLSKYLFSVPSGYTSFLNIAIKAGEVANLRLDGGLILAVFQPVDYSDYVFAQIPIAPGAHRLVADIPFLAIVYGASEPVVNDTIVGAYGYPCGMALVREDSGTQTGSATRSTQTATRNTQTTTHHTQNAETTTKHAQTSQSHGKQSSQTSQHQPTSTRASSTKTSSRTQEPLEGETGGPVSSTTTLLPLSFVTAIACFILMN